MGVILAIRQGVLGATMVSSLIVLALSADLTFKGHKYLAGATIPSFCGLGIAIGVISLVTLPVMFVVDLFRRGAVTSMIVVELAWLFVLCILWVATGGTAVSQYDPVSCSYGNSIFNGMCQESQAMEAFSFLNFIILLLYTVFLCVMAVIAGSRGQRVWLSSVKESFDSPPVTVEHPMVPRAPFSTQPVSIMV